MKVITVPMTAYLLVHFSGENMTHFKLCKNCYKAYKTNYSISLMNRINDYAYLQTVSNVEDCEFYW